MSEKTFIRHLYYDFRGQVGALPYSVVHYFIKGKVRNILCLEGVKFVTARYIIWGPILDASTNIVPFRYTNVPCPVHQSPIWEPHKLLKILCYSIVSCKVFPVHACVQYNGMVNFQGTYTLSSLPHLLFICLSRLLDYTKVYMF